MVHNLVPGSNEHKHVTRFSVLLQFLPWAKRQEILTPVRINAVMVQAIKRWPSIGASPGILVGVVRISLDDATHDERRLKAAASFTQQRLYIAVEGDWSTHSRDWIEARLKTVYDLMAKGFPGLDTCVILPDQGSHVFQAVQELQAIFTSNLELAAIESLAAERKEMELHPLDIISIDVECPLVLRTRCWDAVTCQGLPPGSFENIVLGGTFDRLHKGHKLLLAMSCLAATKRLLIGVSHGALCENKTLEELITPFSQRRERLSHYLQRIRPSLRYDIVPIEDPFGPSITDPNLQCIIVSTETLKGAESVNRRRKAKDLPELNVHVVSLVGQEDSQDPDSKLSSTGSRRDGLGIFCWEGSNPSRRAGGFEGSRDYVRRTPPNSTYVVGLTGGIAAGKKSVCAMLKEHVPHIIDCNKLGHRAYEKGSPAWKQIVSEFGDAIVDSESGEIDRKALGGIVFGHDADMKRLTNIVWPCIRSLLREEIERLSREGVDVCVMEAAVLFEAGWDEMVDEVWMVRVPPNVAIGRLAKRNDIAVEDAQKRINSQWSNKERMHKAHVIISNEWDEITTRMQVEKAWEHLMKRSKLSLPPPYGDGNPGILEAKWSQACDACGIERSLAVKYYRDIWHAHGAFGRFYHTRERMRQMFCTLDGFPESVTSKIQKPVLLTFAIFFHNFVYEPGSTTNMENSVKAFKKFRSETGKAISDSDSQMVCDYIMLAANYDNVQDVEGDCAIFLDCTISMLALHFSQYSRYAENVRREHSSLDSRRFAMQRIDTLSNFLTGMETIYRNPEIRDLLEKNARENMERELRFLKKYVELYADERRWSYVQTPRGSVSNSSTSYVWQS